MNLKITVLLMNLKATNDKLTIIYVQNLRRIFKIVNLNLKFALLCFLLSFSGTDRDRA